MQYLQIDFVSRSEATVTGFLSQQTDDARTVLVENKHGHGEAEVLKVLTYTDKICGEVIVKEKVIDSRLYRCGGFGGAVLQSRTVADLGVEALAGCQSFIFLYEVYSECAKIPEWKEKTAELCGSIFAKICLST